MNFKTQLCKFYQKSGKCKFGSNCAFAHYEYELRNSFSESDEIPNPVETTGEPQVQMFKNNRPDRLQNPKNCTISDQGGNFFDVNSPMRYSNSQHSPYTHQSENLCTQEQMSPGLNNGDPTTPVTQSSQS